MALTGLTMKALIANKITSVADEASLSGIASPVSGDYAYARAEGTLHKYNGTSWASSTEWTGITKGTISKEATNADDTDSNTSGDGKDFFVGRQETTFSIEGFIKDSSGNKLNGLTLNVNFDSKDIAVTGATFTENFDTIESTSSETAANSKEFVTARAERSLDFDFAVGLTDADFVVGNSYSVTVTLAPSITLSGTVKVISSAPEVSIDGQAIVKYSTKFVGSVTESGTSIVNGTNKMFLFVLSGAKSYLGTAVGVSKSYDLQIDSDYTFSQEFKVIGAVSESNG